MEDVSLAQAKEQLEDLLARAARGEDVRISDPRGTTVKLTPVAAPVHDPLRKPRVPGSWKGKISDPPPGFFDPMTEEELKEWYGDDP